MGKCPFGFLHKKKASLLELSNQQEVRIAFNGQELNKQIQLIRLSETDLKALKQLKPLLTEGIHNVVETFYKHVLEVEELSEIIFDNSTPDRLKKTMKRHIEKMLDGDFGDDYVQERLKVADQHYRIELDAHWYMGGFQVLQDTMIDYIFKNIEEQEDSRTLIIALTKVFNLEQQLVLEAYFSHNLKAIEESNNKIRQEVKENIGVSSEVLAAVSDETSASMEELINSSDSVSETVLKTSEQSSHTQSLARGGHEQLSILNTKMEMIQSSAKEMQSLVTELSNSFSEIHQVVNIVKDIAEQTNLLALNSAIEAARAGEHGKGFSVVAQEVRKLAEQTKTSVTSIIDLISKNHDYIEKVVTTLDTVDRSVEEGNSYFRIVNSSFHDIVSSMDESMQFIERAVQEIKQLTRGISEIGQKTGSLAETADALNETARSF